MEIKNKRSAGRSIADFTTGATVGVLTLPITFSREMLGLPFSDRERAVSEKSLAYRIGYVSVAGGTIVATMGYLFYNVLTSV